MDDPPRDAPAAPDATSSRLAELADTMVLGALLARIGPYELLFHHAQGEFHHDVAVRLEGRAMGLPGDVLVVATNCNGGVKEVLAFEEAPTPSALWRWRCPESAEFIGEMPRVLGRATTTHWFPPCELLRPDARSELREEARERQPGGGFRLKRGC
jgi:hypothetical protein